VAVEVGRAVLVEVGGWVDRLVGVRSSSSMPQAASKLETPSPPDPAAAKRKNSLRDNGFITIPAYCNDVRVMIG
jgi:hypothetical protein